MVAGSESLAPGKQRWIDRPLGLLAHDPQRFLSFFLLAYGILWLADTFSFPGIYFDSYEMLAFGREMQWGYWKHPPLPAWLSEIAYEITGGWVHSHVVLAVGSILLTFYLIFILGRDVAGPVAGALAVALSVGCYYFTRPVTTFNHNSAQLPFWVLTVLLYRRAVIAGKTPVWIGLGASAALLLYAKYSGAMLLVVLAAHLCLTEQGRLRLRSPGPWIAVGVCLLLLLPNLVWLVANDFLPFSFPFDRPPVSGLRGRLGTGLMFGVAQLGFHLPMLVLIGLAALPRLPFQGPPVVLDLGRVGTFDRSLILSTALLPILAIMVIAVVAGVEPRPEVGGSLVALSGLAAVVLLPERAKIRAPRLATVAWIVVLVGIPVGHVVSVYSAPRSQGIVASELWPAERLSSAMLEIWRRHSDRPLAIVVGDTLNAEYVALHVSPRASVFIDGDLRKSPWITRIRLEQEGALILWQTNGPVPVTQVPASLLAAFEGKTMTVGGPLELPLGHGDVTAYYGWAVVPPRAPVHN